MLMWMGIFKQIKSFDEHLPDGYKMKVKNYEMGIKTTSMVRIIYPTYIEKIDQVSPLK